MNITKPYKKLLKKIIRKSTTCITFFLCVPEFLKHSKKVARRYTTQKAKTLTTVDRPHAKSPLKVTCKADMNHFLTTVYQNGDPFKEK